jgi:hypothetical protein
MGSDKRLFIDDRPLAPAIALTFIILVGMQGCGIELKRPDMPYYFSHPLLNERWLERAGTPSTQPKKVARASGKAKVRKGRKKDGKARKTAATAPPSAPTQTLRGNELDVVRGEMVLAAQRLLGIGETFTQDSFLRHLLIVNNLGLGDFPEEGVVVWLYQHAGEGAGKVGPIVAGDLLFLGEQKPEQCVVVETVEGDGRIGFIGYISGRVQRGVMSINQRTARRDEKSQKVLNTFVGKSRLAGGLLLGSYRLDRHKERLARQN